MPKGLPKYLIKKYGVSKKAWRIFKAKKRSKSRKKVTKRKNPKRRTRRRMARRRKGRRRYSMTIPMAPIAGLAVGLAEPIQKISQGNWVGGLNQLGERYTGYNALAGNFNFKRLEKGLLPLVLGALVHKFVGGAPLNLNKTLARAKVPFIRI